MEIVKTNTSFLDVLGSYSKNGHYFGNYNTLCHLDHFTSSHYLNGISIIFGCQGSIFLIPYFLKIFFFLIYARNFTGLSKLRMGQNKGFILGRLCLLESGLFDMRFLGDGSLGLHF